jgi:hypothetical protein
MCRGQTKSGILRHMIPLIYDDNKRSGQGTTLDLLFYIGVTYSTKSGILSLNHVGRTI